MLFGSIQTQVATIGTTGQNAFTLLRSSQSGFAIEGNGRAHCN